MPPLTWHHVQGLLPRSYVCGYCNRNVGPDKGWQTPQQTTIRNQAIPDGYVYVCSFCGKPSFFYAQKQYPGVPSGNIVESLPKDVGDLYDEARRCVAVNSFTAAVLTCRKLLMHIAVEKQAESGKSFMFYVEYLAGKGYVPPEGKGRVDHIRNKGNEANHEIKIISPEDAAELITFLEMLLKFVYEFPARIPQVAPANPAPAQP
jgi:Domain of unknown function (DUF4145)